jgi:hypothetical protein
MKALKWIGSMLAALALLLLLYGTTIEPRLLLDTEPHQVEVPDLPAEWDGQTIALIADLQVGMWWGNTGMVRKAVRKIIETRPALVVIAGDFVYSPDSAVVREAVSLVQPLAEAGLSTVAVLGNHDYSLSQDRGNPAEEIASYLEAQLEQVGIKVLQNEALSVAAPGGGPPLYVVGIDSEWADHSRPGEALAGLPEDAARVVVMHNPITYRALPAAAAPLAMAGHTHAGQIRLKGLPSQSWLDIARPHEVIAEGWAADSIGAPGNRLYVNRGIGFSIVPVRIWCMPELTLFTLERAGSEVPERGPST